MIVKTFSWLMAISAAGLACGQSPTSAGINYTTAQWVPLTLARQQPSDGTQVWCLMANAFGSTPANSVIPTMLDETRKSRIGLYEVMVEVQPGGPTIAETPEEIKPISGAVFARTAVALPYPFWTRNVPGCSNNPSLTFSAKSLHGGESREGVKILIAF